MTQKTAVAVVHGIGKQEPDFADKSIRLLKKRFAKKVGIKKVSDPKQELECKPVYWASALQNSEDQLWKRLQQGGKMNWMRLRNFMVDFCADAIAYQLTPSDRKVYDDIHAVVANALKALAVRAGQKAPLCVIAHSLGAVIASNYFYDLQIEFGYMGVQRQIVSPDVKKIIDTNPLEHGETLTLFFTLGSPIAIWSLRYQDFGSQIAVPSPVLRNHYPVSERPDLIGEWINFYDRDDIIGYPLRTLNDKYKAIVKEDREVKVGWPPCCWTPLCHDGYWTDEDVIEPIADALAKVWNAVNP